MLIILMRQRHFVYSLSVNIMFVGTYNVHLPYQGCAVFKALEVIIEG